MELLRSVMPETAEHFGAFGCAMEVFLMRGTLGPCSHWTDEYTMTDCRVPHLDAPRAVRELYSEMARVLMPSALVAWVWVLDDLKRSAWQHSLRKDLGRIRDDARECGVIRTWRADPDDAPTLASGGWLGTPWVLVAERLDDLGLIDWSNVTSPIAH